MSLSNAVVKKKIFPELTKFEAAQGKAYLTSDLEKCNFLE
jgi:hypothetical protein